MTVWMRSRITLGLALSVLTGALVAERLSSQEEDTAVGVIDVGSEIDPKCEYDACFTDGNCSQHTEKWSCDETAKGCQSRYC